ncbi:MAG: hypothetical protein ACREEB_01515 [Caulobacteraceae bacterium]
MTSQLNASAAELTEACVERFEAGGRVAELELRTLASLAAAIGRSVGEWRALTAQLELARALDVPRAAALILETVFDEVLAPAAWRVLADLMDQT